MKEWGSYFINIDELADVLNAGDNLNKLYGHLYLMKEKGVIKQLYGNNELGLCYDDKGISEYNGCLIRMTSDGYDFLEMSFE